VLDGGPDPPWEGQFWGRGAHCKYRDTLRFTCAKVAEPIEMPFGLWAWSGSRHHELDGGPDALTRRDSFGGKGHPL